MPKDVKKDDIQLKNLGKLFKSRRKTLELRQQDIAKKVGICVQQYSRIERGEFTPSLQTFFKLVNALDIDLSALKMKSKSISTTMYEIMALLEKFTSTQQKAVLSLLQTMTV